MRHSPHQPPSFPSSPTCFCSFKIVSWAWVLFWSIETVHGHNEWTKEYRLPSTSIEFFECRFVWMIWYLCSESVNLKTYCKLSYIHLFLCSVSFVYCPFPVNFIVANIFTWLYFLSSSLYKRYFSAIYIKQKHNKYSFRLVVTFLTDSSLRLEVMSLLILLTLLIACLISSSIVCFFCP